MLDLLLWIHGVFTGAVGLFYAQYVSDLLKANDGGERAE